MKKIMAILFTLSLALTLVACGKDEPVAQERPGTINSESMQPSATESERPFADYEENQASQDNYTWYIKNYVGKNAASFGHTNYEGCRVDDYESGEVKLILLSPSGEYVDIQDKEELKNWYVVAQNQSPNTEIRYTYMQDENGKEYKGLVNYQSIDEIVLAVAPVGSEGEVPQVTTIQPSTDAYTFYVRDYVGRNLSQCGFTSFSGERVDEYGHAQVVLTLVADNGVYIDAEEEESLRNYVVTGQSISANTKLTMTFLTDEEGKEYVGIVDDLSIEQIDLFVRQLDPNAVTEEEEPTEPEEETTEPTEEVTEPTEESIQLVDGLRPEFKEAMDAYEAFYDEYCELMTKYMKNPSDLTLMTQYMELLDKSGEMDEAFEKWDDEDMSPAELQYYLEVTDRVMDKLLKAMG